ncbi:MAG: hypothetical protein WCJ28_06560 [Actinomycetota bacterium]
MAAIEITNLERILEANEAWLKLEVRSAKDVQRCNHYSKLIAALHNALLSGSGICEARGHLVSWCKVMAV